MKTQLQLLTILPLLLLQIACSHKDKTEAVAYCQSNAKECAQKYIQLTGGAAASGTAPQVASPSQGTSVGAAQVPSTSILPASVSKDQIEAKAAEVQAALKAYDESGGDISALTGASTSTSSPVIKAESVSHSVASSAGATSVDVGVTRISDETPVSNLQPSSVEVRTPASVTSDAIDNGSTFSGGASR